MDRSRISKPLAAGLGGSSRRRRAERLSLALSLSQSLSLTSLLSVLSLSLPLVRESEAEISSWHRFRELDEDAVEWVGDAARPSGSSPWLNAKA